MPIITGITKPSSIRRSPLVSTTTPIDGFDPRLSLPRELLAQRRQRVERFQVLDGHYHSVITLTRWPKMIFPGIIPRLTNLRLLDYNITINLIPFRSVERF
jgi:hypothetical protein